MKSVWAAFDSLCCKGLDWLLYVISFLQFANSSSCRQTGGLFHHTIDNNRIIFTVNKYSYEDVSAYTAIHTQS